MRRLNFSGGEQVEDMLAKIIRQAQEVGTLKVGFLEGSTYPDGTSVPTVAAFNEFGTTKMPPRPFFRTMILEKSPSWGKSLGNIAKAQNYDVARTLGLMGMGIGDQLQASIVKYNAVPLADSTIARKGFAKQLIDTAVMVNSVGYEVNDGDKVILPPAAEGGGK